MNQASRGVLFPGFAAPRGVERRQLRSGEVVRIALGTGDLLDITNVDGGASARIFPLESDGSLNLSSLGLSDRDLRPAAVDDFDSREMRAWLSARGRSHDDLMAAEIFGPAILAGDHLTLRAAGPCEAWVAAPCSLDALTYGGAGGEFDISVKRARDRGTLLPEPLGEIRDEFTIERATARGYEVAAGELIQIIDVEGRQCSDFTAFRREARFIDSTVSRSMNGTAYPGPGLFDRFLDQDARPIVSVLQDTVGRHDTFGLACTARGYEERGFPGHANCSDNLSDALAPYGIARRAAWPAINFFWNSWILPNDNVLRSDESWSRAGDYVAMRAAEDLVCATTACPDDIDPINGWNPTDIHVRIYRKEQPVRHAIAYRANETSEAILCHESAFHARTSALTQRFVTARDLWLPTNYSATGAIEEYWACRQAVTIQDMSSLRKFDVMGPDSERLLQMAMTRDIGKLAQHRCVYALICDDTGAVIDDGTLFHIAPHVFRWCCGSEESGRHLKALAERHGMRVWIKSLHSAMPNIAIQGPRSRDLLRKIVHTHPRVPDIEAMKWFGCTVGRLNDRDGAPFMLTRSGFTGELGYEIFCDARHAIEIWDAVMAAGEEFGIVPMGLEALNTLRVEAGLMVAGAEFGPETDAFECGLGFAVDLKKEDFIGREALVRAAETPKRRLAGLIFDGDEAPEHGDGVFAGSRRIGTVTSGARSPMLGHAIALARLAVEHAEVGTELEVGRLDGHMKRLAARVADIPLFDPMYGPAAVCN